MKKINLFFKKNLFNIFIILLIVVSAGCSEGGDGQRPFLPPQPPTDCCEPASIVWYSFKVLDNNFLLEDINGVITGTDITITVPSDTVVNNLIASFETASAVKIMVNSIEQESGKTGNNFTNTVIYQVFNKENESRNYRVTVTKSNDNSPQNVSASDGDYNDYIHVRWSAVQGAVVYNIYRANSLDGVYTQIATRSYCSFADKAVSQGSVYHYKVAAIFSDNSISSRSISNSGYIKTIIIPGIPTGVNASTNRSLHVKISWNQVSDASKYEVYRADFYNGSYQKIGETDSLLYDDYTGIINVDYYYKVKAISNTNGESALSNYVTGQRDSSYVTRDSYEELDIDGGPLLRLGSYLYRNLWISSGRDSDCFHFSGNTGRKYVIETSHLPGTNNDADTTMAIYDVVHYSSFYDYYAIDYNNGEGNFSKIVFTPPYSLTYYVWITPEGPQATHVDYFYKVTLIDSRAKVNIINECNYEIVEFYARLSGTSNWGTNLIKSGSILQETNRLFDVGNGLEFYDFKVVNSNGQVGTTLNKRFEENAVFDWTLLSNP